MNKNLKKILYLLIFVVLITFFYVKLTPFSSNSSIIRTIVVVPVGKSWVTNYHAVAEQCDSTPDIGAYGKIAQNGVPLGYYGASNKYPKNTKLWIPAISSTNIYTIMDRTAKGRKNIDLVVPVDVNFGVFYTQVYKVISEFTTQ